GELMKPYDLIVLHGAHDAWLNMVHVHGDAPDLRVDDAIEYPAQAISWATHTTGRRLGDLRPSTSQALVGGLDHTAAVLTDPGLDEAAAVEYWLGEARRAVVEAGNALVLAPGCSMPAGSNPLAFRALRTAIEML